MSTNLSSYLAQKYLTASTISSPDSSRPKKRRKRDHQNFTTLTIRDDDADFSFPSSTNNPANNDEEDIPTYDRSIRSAEFRKKKTNNWKTVSDSLNEGAKVDGGDDAARILAEAAEEAEMRRRVGEEEDAPAVVNDVDEVVQQPRMSSGAKVGLQLASDTALIEAEAARNEGKKKKKRDKSKGEEEAREEETIYRDATGRRIDISMRRAELRKAEEEKIRAEKREKENAMGDVQRGLKEERKKDLEEAKFLSLGRGVEDEELNDLQRGKEVWGDPMAGYVSRGRGEDGGVERSKGGNSGVQVTKGKKTVGRTYQGAAPPNRYGIKPGWRWDGVDRGNGFEKEWFQARSRKDRIERLEYEWQEDE